MNGPYHLDLQSREPPCTADLILRVGKVKVTEVSGEVKDYDKIYPLGFVEVRDRTHLAALEEMITLANKGWEMKETCPRNDLTD